VTRVRDEGERVRHQAADELADEEYARDSESEPQPANIAGATFGAVVETRARQAVAMTAVIMTVVMVVIMIVRAAHLPRW